MDRVPLCDDDFATIEPRPIRPAPKPSAPEIVPPKPSEPRPDPAQAIIKGSKQQDGVTEADRLLAAIVNVARREPPNHGALRTLISRFSREYALDF